MHKKLLVFPAALLLGLSLFAAPASAAEFKGGQMLVVGSGDDIHGDLYAAGTDVSVDTKMPGDAFVAGSIVRVNGDVGQSLFAAGSMVNIGANVADDVRVAGSQVMIGGHVYGDVMSAGGVLNILPNAVIDGDVYIAGGSVVIEGKVNGYVHAAGGEVALKGEVGKDVNVRTDSKLTVGPNAKVGGKLYYESPNEATIDQAASITGGVDYKKVERQDVQKAERKGGFGGFAVAWWFGTLLSMLALTFLVWYFFRQRVAEVTARALDGFAAKLGWGFIWLVVTPIAAIILMFTLIGIPVSLFVFLVYAVVIAIAKILANIILGTWVMKLIYKDRGWVADWKAVLVGVILMSLLMLIPFLGWLICFVFFLVALGALMEALRPLAK